jgi:cytochrome c oxidase subunit 3
MHGYQGGSSMLILGIMMIMYSMFVWWRDVVRESTFEGHHTFLVQLGLRYGMILFIVSEIMFFVAFFWAFFHSSLAPTVEIGALWPPKGIAVLNPWEIPFLNTVILIIIRSCCYLGSSCYCCMEIVHQATLWISCYNSS